MEGAHFTPHQHHHRNSLQTNQAQDIVHLVEDIPPTMLYKIPTKEEFNNTQNAKRRKSVIKEFTGNSKPNKLKKMNCV